MGYDAYMEMATGVMQQACEDYVNSQLKLMGIKKIYHEETNTYEYRRRFKELKSDTIAHLRWLIMDCIVFFKSDWCERLSPNYNGQILIDLLNERVRDDIAEFEKQEAEILKQREEKRLERQRKKEKKEEPVTEVKQYTQTDINKGLEKFEYCELN